MSIKFWANGTLAGIGAALVACLAVSLSAAAADAAVIVDRGAPAPKIGKVSDSSVAASPVRATPAAADEFWTRERMLAAEPAENRQPAGSLDLPDLAGRASASAAQGDFTPGNVTAFPQRLHGKVFFRVGSEVFACSGTVVDAAKRNVVFTAGHCVFDQATQSFVDELVFVPGYEGGVRPYGIFHATRVFTTPQWVANGANSYDIGVAVLDQPVQRSLGARQIAFDLRPKGSRYTIFGYPSKPNPPYDGEVLRGCRARFAGRDGAQNGNITPFPVSAHPCTMQQGASGGGWITLGNYLNSVVSYGYCDSVPKACGLIFGPYFSNAAKSLYLKAGGSSAPTVKLRKAPPRAVRKRRVNFRFAGSAATLLGFICRLDRQRPVRCSSRISINRLSRGRHVLRVRAVDQTGHKSKRQIVRRFRVILPRR